jgi:YHS domain-containing protein
MKKYLFILLSTLSLAIAGDYPLSTCVISGEKLGEMGKPYVFKYQGTEVRLCCENCQAKFDKDPAKYLAKIAGASKAGN